MALTGKIREEISALSILRLFHIADLRQVK